MKRFQIRSPDEPFRREHRPITSTVTISEHAQLAELARQAGKPTTTYVTGLLRDHLSRQSEVA